MKILPLLKSILLLTLISSCGDKNTSEIDVLNEHKQLTIKRKVFIPPNNKVLMFIGQDSETITDYINTVPEDNIEGITLYTSLKSADINSALPAVFQKTNWQAGDVDFNASLLESPDAAIAIGLAFDMCGQVDHAKNIANNQYQPTVIRLISHLKSLAPRKVFLRIGYEFDGPWNCYTPKNYIAAFKNITDEINAQSATNINTVWQTAAWPAGSDAGDIYDTRNADHFDKWYPGDNYVDWVSISVFYRDFSQWSYTPSASPDVIQENALTFARQHNKPVMIAESAPQGYRLGALTHSYIQMNDPSPRTAQQIWDNWFVPYFNFIEQNNDVIRAVAYINTHWENQAMWQCLPNIPAPEPGCSQGNWGDSRIQANEYIKTKWLEKVNNDNLWQQSSDYK